MPRPDYPGAVCHVITRGNARQKIFFSQEDYERFLGYCARLKAVRPFKLYAYCLMPNHIHLLIETMDFSLSVIVGLLLNRYAKYLNARYKRVGHVFQGRFKTRLCRKDAYFQQLVRYIHLNPVKSGLVVEPAAWDYSGHLEYLGQSERNLLDAGMLLSMFNEDSSLARAAYLRFVLEGMKLPPDAEQDDVFKTPALAADEAATTPFIAIKAKPRRSGLEVMSAACAAAVGVSADALRGSSRMPAIVQARHDLMCRAFREGFSFTEIAAHLHLSTTAVSKVISQVM